LDLFGGLVGSAVGTGNRVEAVSGRPAPVTEGMDWTSSGERHSPGATACRPRPRASRPSLPAGNAAVVTSSYPMAALVPKGQRTWRVRENIIEGGDRMPSPSVRRRRHADEIRVARTSGRPGVRSIRHVVWLGAIPNPTSVPPAETVVVTSPVPTSCGRTVVFSLWSHTRRVASALASKLPDEARKWNERAPARASRDLVESGTVVAWLHAGPSRGWQHLWGAVSLRRSWTFSASVRG
jgi:hypothetical protein